MGLVFVEGTVTGPTGRQEKLEFLVDSGATYTLLPNHTWRSIGLIAKRSVGFALVDGTRIERQVSECHITLPQGDGHTPVILGEPGDEALLVSSPWRISAWFSIPSPARCSRCG